MGLKLNTNWEKKSPGRKKDGEGGVRKKDRPLMKNNCGSGRLGFEKGSWQGGRRTKKKGKKL